MFPAASKVLWLPSVKRTSHLVDDLKTYRPVLGHSFISNLDECVVAKQLLEYLRP